MLYFTSVLLGDKYYYFQIIYEAMALQMVTCQGHTFGAEPRVHPVGHRIQSGPVLFLIRIYHPMFSWSFALVDHELTAWSRNSDKFVT